MNRQQQQDHAIRIVATYLNDNLPFDNVYEDDELIGIQDDDAVREIHDLCGEIISQIHTDVSKARPWTYWEEEYADED